jgi:2-methylaconitate cis-trans-isomerase PrpF
LINSGKLLIAEVPVKGGKACVEGDYSIDGVPGTGARITMDWSDTVGSICGKLLPTGNARDVITADGTDYPVSLVDIGNPLVFIKASSLGMTGIEMPGEIESNKKLMETIEKIRSRAAVIFGLTGRPEDARHESPYNPFFAIISRPADYFGMNGKAVQVKDVDIVSRLIFMLKPHKAYPVSGTVCTGAAFKIPGSIAYETLDEAVRDNVLFHIGHPTGVIPVEVESSECEGNISFERICVYRTSRTIMDGYVYVRKSVFR